MSDEFFDRQQAEIVELSDEIARLTRERNELRKVLVDCQTVLCESQRGEDLKTLSDAELGRLWTSLESRVTKALANTEQS